MILVFAALCGQAAAQAESPPALQAQDEGVLEQLGQFLVSLFHVSTRDLEQKAIRVAVVLFIGLSAKFIMDLVQWASRLLIHSQWGPLRYAFSNRQRSITLHALFISLVRYVVYFTALGYILSEFGIDYKTYLASLSLVGIALGFGAQGLVQDVVTGFFILFEDQFSVGDMVEIAGQVGMVEEIGLRTVRLRSYQGAQLIFQNRNIPVVSRYRKGGVEAGVDVAITSREAAERAGALLGQLGAELEKQFREIIMAPPQVTGLIELETGELFVRLRVKIWPLQQWVVESQLAPRIRELFKREGIEIPAERVVVFYHFPEEQQAPQDLLSVLRGRGRDE